MDVEGQLQSSGAVYDRLWQQRVRELQGGAQLLARDYGFRAAVATGDTATRSRYSASLLDEVRDAIRDLAEQGEETDYAEADEYFTPATEPPPHYGEDTVREPSTTAGEPFKPRRTAKRTPPTSSIT